MAAGDDYITLADVQPHIFQYNPEQDVQLQDCISWACALFDKLCYASRGYFSQRASESASDLIVYGNGMTILPLPPYSGLVGISMGAGYTVPDYVEMDGSLQIVDQNGNLVFLSDPNPANVWPSGAPITINAVWGHDAVPADVKEACTELTAAIFRGKDQAFLRAVNIDSNIALTNAIPVRVKMIAARYRNSLEAGSAFV